MANPQDQTGQVQRRRKLDRRFAVRALLTAVWTANLTLVAITISGFLVSDPGYDWAIYTEAGRRVFTGGLYTWDSAYAWSYSPLLAYGFAGLAPLGYAGWSALHLAALAGLRDWRLVLVTASSWPFWVDLYNGNTMVFVFVAAAAAVRGSAIGAASYLGLAVLIPRPLMLPVLAWILWHRPAWRAYFSVMFVVYAVLIFATGQAAEWLGTLTRVSDAVAASSRDVGPRFLLGAWWLPLGAILAVFLTMYGRIGLASMAASPYWLPQYLLMMLLEFAGRKGRAVTPELADVAAEVAPA
jgi:hypothetical protein